MEMNTIDQMSLLEVAVNLMKDKHGKQSINKIIEETLEMKGLVDEDGSLATQLYVDITTSAKFVYMGNDEYDLKSRQKLDEWDKDGSAFNVKGEAGDEDDDEDEESSEESEENEYDDNNDYRYDDEDDDDEDEDDEDEDDDDDYDSASDSDDALDSAIEYNEDEFDEDKYNDLMDDYEDIYDEN